jgi:hypothetical protein
MHDGGPAYGEHIYCMDERYSYGTLLFFIFFFFYVYLSGPFGLMGETCHFLGPMLAIPTYHNTNYQFFFSHIVYSFDVCGVMSHNFPASTFLNNPTTK